MLPEAAELSFGREPTPDGWPAAWCLSEVRDERGRRLNWDPIFRAHYLWLSRLCGYLSDLYGEPNDAELVFWPERCECGLRA